MLNLILSPLTRGRGLKQIQSDKLAASIKSPLTRGRGLKQFNRIYLELEKVAPHTGAWIETLIYLPFFVSFWSPLTRGRGLKLSPRKTHIPSPGRPSHGGVD